MDEVSHGGRRKGAGAKPLPANEKRIAVAMRIAPETHVHLYRMKEITGLSLGQVIDAWAEELEKRHK